MNAVALPSRKDRQSLDGYVRQHLRHLEGELFSGVPYQALVSAVQAAGFAKVTLRAIRSAVYRARKRRPSHARNRALQTAVQMLADAGPQAMEPMAEAKDERAAIGRRFRELARPPGIRGEEPDLLI
jgi:hypothetical protein